MTTTQPFTFSTVNFPQYITAINKKRPRKKGYFYKSDCWLPDISATAIISYEWIAQDVKESKINQLIKKKNPADSKTCVNSSNKLNREGKGQVRG